MKDLVKNLANLLKVKTLVTIAVIAVFIMATVRGVLQPSDIKEIVLMVVAFYFGTQHEKNTLT